MEADQHNIVQPNGSHAHIFAVPNCTFNGVQVCLSTKNPKEIKKCRAMVPEFKRFMAEQARRYGPGSLIIGG